MIAGLAVTLCLGGCATFEMTTAAPRLPAPLAVQYSPEPFGADDVPIGVYKVPGSQALIAGRKEVGEEAGMFGLLGIAIADANASAANKEAFKNAEQSLKIKLVPQEIAITSGIVDGSASLSGKFTMNPTKGGPTLLVTSAVVLSFVDDAQARLYVMLHAKLNSPGTKEQWETRYIVSSGPPRPIAGANSWIETSQTGFQDAIGSNLKRAISFMLADIADPVARDKTNLRTIQGYVPYIRGQVQMVGYLIAEDGDTLAFVPKVQDAYTIAGVNIMDKTVTVQRLTQKDDPDLKVIDDKAK